MNEQQQYTSSFESTTGSSHANEENSKTQVYIVDDHPAIREALTTSLNSKLDMRVIGESATAETALREMQRYEPDVAIIDISLDDAHGLDLVKKLRDQYPNLRIVVFSMYDESVYAERAIRAGASGYVMKSASTEEVVNAVQAVGRGDVYLSQRMSSRILSKVIRQENYAFQSATEQLTDREMTVFQKLGAGTSVREIAEELDLSRKTVETYRRRAKEKLGFESVDELLQYAVQWTYGHEKSYPKETEAPESEEADS